MPKIIYKVLLIISLGFNIALYFGWLGLDQYKGIVDKWVQTTKDIANDPSTKEFLEMSKQKFKDAYWENIENLKVELKWKTKEAAMNYMMDNYSWINLSDMAQIIEDADLEEMVNDTKDTVENNIPSK